MLLILPSQRITNILPAPLHPPRRTHRLPLLLQQQKLRPPGHVVQMTPAEIMGEDFEQWRRGDKIITPSTPNEWDELIINFFLTIHKIVAKENHTQKYDGVRQVIDVLNDAATVEGINLFFFECDGEWGLRDTGYSLHDLIRLDDLAYRFSRIYRHQALDYRYNDGGDVDMLMEGKKG